MLNLHIDLESQKNALPGYPIVNRAIYYSCRRISMQLQKVSDNETGYRALEKVYSIWVCLENIPEKERNSVAYYKIQNYKNEGISPKDSGDLLEVVIIRLGGENPPEGILDMLEGIFSGNKKKAMKYIPCMDREDAREVEEMLSLVEYAEEKGIKKGRKEGLKEGIKAGCISTLANLVKDGILSVPDAAKRAGVSEAEFRKYME